VIIRDYLRFAAGEGMQPIPVSEYHQMAGRAGRPRLDPYGEAVLIAKEEGQVEELFNWYIDAPAEEVHSKIADPAALYTHVLSLIASGFVASRHELLSFMDRSFYVHEHRKSRLMQKAVDMAVDFLASSDMIVIVGGHLGSTGFGSLVSRLYIDPRSAAMIVSCLRKTRKYSDLGLLQLVCSTPDMPKLYVRNSDIAALSRLLDARAGDLWLALQPDEDDAEAFYRALKTSLLLFDWTDEFSDAKICERYSVGPGDIYGMVENVNWLLHASAELSRMFAPEFHLKIRDYEICMKNGIRRELLPLVRIRGIGRVRARRLFNNGITSPELLLARGKEDITKILGRGITEQIFEYLQKREDHNDIRSGQGDLAGGQSSLFHFGE
jgi:helicase